MSELKSIETWYNGRVYRSRTEARYAVLFDTLGEPFQYEVEGFNLPPIPFNPTATNIYVEPSVISADLPVFYLPDFWLPRAQQWIEIKPLRGDDVLPEPIEMEKAARLAYHSGQQVVLVCGIPGQAHDGSYRAYASTGDTDYLWCACRFCGAVGLQYGGRSDRLACKESADRMKPGCPRMGNDRGETWDMPRLWEALQTANRYRFPLGKDALFHRGIRE